MRLIIKARTLPPGSVRTHGGVKKRKRADGKWVPVKSQGEVRPHDFSKKPRHPRDTLVNRAKKHPNWKFLTEHIGASLTSNQGRYMLSGVSNIRVGSKTISADVTASVGPDYKRKVTGKYRLTQSGRKIKGGITLGASPPEKIRKPKRDMSHIAVAAAAYEKKNPGATFTLGSVKPKATITDVTPEGYGPTETTSKKSRVGNKLYTLTVKWLTGARKGTSSEIDYVGKPRVGSVKRGEWGNKYKVLSVTEREPYDDYLEV